MLSQSACCFWLPYPFICPLALCSSLMTYVPYRILFWSCSLISALLHRTVISSWTILPNSSYSPSPRPRPVLLFPALVKKHHLSWPTLDTWESRCFHLSQNTPQVILKFPGILKTIYLFILIATSTALVQTLKTSALELPFCPFPTTHHMLQRDLPKTQIQFCHVLCKILQKA